MTKNESHTMDLQRIIQTLPQTGRVDWIGIRPQRGAPVQVVPEVIADTTSGLSGDHYSKHDGSRQVTLIQAEHLSVVANFLHIEQVDPTLTRRNIVVSGINLLAFKDRQFRVGDVVLEMTGICHPCTKLERYLGPGAYNAMRGHSGITAKIVRPGRIRTGDTVQLYLTV